LKENFFSRQFLPKPDYFCIISTCSFNKIYSRVPARHARLACKALRAGLNEKMYYTYVLESKKDKKLYVGFTEDLKKRFKEHELGLVDATKNRTPFILVYYEACRDRKKAIQREKYFKTGFGRRFLNNRI